MHYNVGRNGEQLGQFSEEEIRAGLFDGRYLSTDLGWTEGMTDWKPLGELFAVTPPPIAVRPTLGQPVPPPRTFSVSQGSSTSGLAIASLVLGLLSLITCSLLGVGALAAIICGHLAMSRIKSSNGAVGGRGMALTGLITGYLSLIVVVLLMVISITVPIFASIEQKADQSASLRHAREIITACQVYAADHEGKFPESLEVLLHENIVTDASIFRESDLHDDTEMAFDYFGAGMNESTASDAVVLTGKYVYPGNNERVIGRKNGDVSVETESSHH